MVNAILFFQPPASLIKNVITGLSTMYDLLEVRSRLNQDQARRGVLLLFFRVFFILVSLEASWYSYTCYLSPHYYYTSVEINYRILHTTFFVMRKEEGLSLPPTTLL